MAEQKLMEGTVDGYSEKNGGIKIGDAWYNVSNKEAQIPPNLKKGCKVKFKYSKGKNAKGQVGNQIRTKVSVTEEAPKYEKKGGFKGKGGWNNRDQGSIERQNSLAHATALVVATMKTTSDVEKAAQKVVEIADSILLPYIQKKTEEKKQESFEDPDETFEEAEETFEDLEDDTPFEADEEDDAPY